MPRVTIGIPVFNGERYLARTLASVLGQTYEDLEVVISDNASTDRTAEICRDAGTGDRRIRYRHNESNLGAAANYNLLVREARGEYFKWSPHDDLLDHACIERTTAGLDAHPDAVLCYSGTLRIDDVDRPLGPEILDRLAVTAARPHERLQQLLSSLWTFPRCNAVVGLIRTAQLRRTRMIGPYASSDKVLLAELSLLGTFVRVEELLMLRREHDLSSMRAHPDADSRTRWFDPSYRGRFQTPNIRWASEYARGVLHADLPLDEKVRCMTALREQAGRMWPRIRHELGDALLPWRRMPGHGKQMS